MAKQQTYKEALLTALECLEDAEGHAMSAVLNIAFAGAYKELGRLYEVGEILEFDPAMFQDSGDINIDLILNAVATINDAIASLKNINSIDLD